ncbi:hypothetical protein IHE44_0005543 [Lamprotornis superbus]|uniref:Uncharacterized protein n=1 Tax=Lamprotornis superbus TaxID=245042 RepID=A0A835TZ97_9PASS|nr:hypothetical protein IHE44_0005543 [Lamprotornis superbus]
MPVCATTQNVPSNEHNKGFTRGTSSIERGSKNASEQGNEIFDGDKQKKKATLISPVQTKAAFQLEEALEQIKGSVLTPNINKINFRTTDDTSSSSASRSDSFHQKQNSAMFGCDEIIQESSRTDMDSHQLLFQKNLKEIQQLLEKQHLNSLENFHQEVKETDDSASLMSLDSLEAGEQNGNCTTQSESSFTTQCDCALYDPEKCQTRNNGLLHTDQSTSKNAHLNNCLRNVDLLHHHNIPIHDLLAKYNVLTPAEHANISEEESSASHRSRKQPAEFSTSGKQRSSVSNAFSFLQNRKDRSKPSSGTAHTFTIGHPVFNPIRAWDSPDSFPGEKIQDLMQDQSFKMTPQERTKSMQASSQPVATSVILFCNQGCSTGIPSTADVLPKDKNISTGFLKNTLGKMTETKEENIKCINDIISETSLFQGIPNASVLLEVKQQNNKGGKGNIIETMSLLPDAEFNSDTPAQKNILKNNILERKRTKLFTSILKKDSKYEPSHFKAVVTDHGISFGTQRMSSIRDSLELAKIKKKSAENEKFNRKLKWCDQIDEIIIENNEKCYEKSISEISSSQLQCVQTANNAPKNNLSIVAQPSNPMFIKNHQENSHISKPNVNTEKSNKEYPSQDIFTPTGSFSAKKAWMLSKDEASKPPVCSNNATIKEGGQLKNKAKIARRATSVRVQSHFMPKKTRGTMIQLQSATEANKTQKAPGKYLTPHPPSTPLPGDRSVENTASPGCQSLPPASLQATSASNSDCTDRHVVLASQVLKRNSAENSENAAGCAGLVTAISTPDCSTAKYESWAKNTCSVNNVQASACQDHSVTCSERRPVNTENELQLYHIPAAGKISTFWHGAHSTQAPKDSATGGVPVTRQNQVFDNYENKHRAFSECRRQNIVSKIWKPAHHAQVNIKYYKKLKCYLSSKWKEFQEYHRFPFSFEVPPVISSVSESTAQFLVAEKLASTPVAESKILAAMDHVKPAGQPSLLKRALCPGRSALSIEEQKIFQSLDCLNQKLQNYCPLCHIVLMFFFSINTERLEIMSSDIAADKSKCLSEYYLCNHLKNVDFLPAFYWCSLYELPNHIFLAVKNVGKLTVVALSNSGSKFYFIITCDYCFQENGNEKIHIYQRNVSVQILKIEIFKKPLSETHLLHMFCNKQPLWGCEKTTVHLLVNLSNRCDLEPQLPFFCLLSYKFSCLWLNNFTYFNFGAQINAEFPAKGIKQTNKEHFELELKIGLSEILSPYISVCQQSPVTFQYGCESNPTLPRSTFSSIICVAASNAARKKIIYYCIWEGTTANSHHPLQLGFRMAGANVPEASIALALEAEVTGLTVLWIHNRNDNAQYKRNQKCTGRVPSKTWLVVCGNDQTYFSPNTLNHICSINQEIPSILNINPKPATMVAVIQAIFLFDLLTWAVMRLKHAESLEGCAILQLEEPTEGEITITSSELLSLLLRQSLCAGNLLFVNSQAVIVHPEEDLMDVSDERPLNPKFGGQFPHIKHLRAGEETGQQKHAILKGCYTGDIQRGDNWLENTYLQKRDPLYALSTHPPSPIFKDLVDVLCSSGHEHMTGKERKWHSNDKHYKGTISNKETAPGTACQTVATKIHKCWLHRLISPGFTIAAKILKYACFLLSLGLYYFFFSVSLYPLPYQYLRKMVAGPEASGSKVWQAAKKRKGKGVSNSANYGITISGRPCSKVQSLPKAIWVHMERRTRLLWPLVFPLAAEKPEIYHAAQTFCPVSVDYGFHQSARSYVCAPRFNLHKDNLAIESKISNSNESFSLTLREKHGHMRRKSGEKIVVIFLPCLCKENQQFPGFGTQSEGRCKCLELDTDNRINLQELNFTVYSVQCLLCWVVLVLITDWTQDLDFNLLSIRLILHDAEDFCRREGGAAIQVLHYHSNWNRLLLCHQLTFALKTDALHRDFILQQKNTCSTLQMSSVRRKNPQHFKKPSSGSVFKRVLCLTFFFRLLFMTSEDTEKQTKAQPNFLDIGMLLSLSNRLMGKLHFGVMAHWGGLGKGSNGSPCLGLLGKL